MTLTCGRSRGMESTLRLPRSLSSLTLLATLLVLGAMPSAATLVTWYLDGVTFDDGGSASGSFIFDADTVTYSGVSISTTPGSAFTGALYDYEIAGTAIYFYALRSFDLPTFIGDPFFLLGYSSPLTNAGGVIPLSISPEGLCNDAGCFEFSNFRQTNGGSVTTTQPGGGAGEVPEPSTFTLFLLAMATLFLFRWRSLKHKTAR